MQLGVLLQAYNAAEFHRQASAFKLNLHLAYFADKIPIWGR